MCCSTNNVHCPAWNHVLLSCIGVRAGLQAPQNLRVAAPAPQSRSNQHVMCLACEPAFNVMVWERNVCHLPTPCEEPAIVLEWSNVSHNIRVSRFRCAVVSCAWPCIACPSVLLLDIWSVTCAAILLIHQPAQCCASRACQSLAEINQDPHDVCNPNVAAEQKRADL